MLLRAVCSAYINVRFAALDAATGDQERQSGELWEGVEGRSGIKFLDPAILRVWALEL